ncbi:MAG: serine protease [Bacteroidota bacterium]|nr:serine protease [Bacteroidota bacterium]
MKALICFLFLFVFPATSFSQDEQSRAIGETMANTFNLHGEQLTGSCFLITKEGKQYFVTAAHLFKPSHKSGDLVSIQMLIQNQLQSFKAKVYFHADRNVDIALIKLSEKISQNIQLPEEFIKYNELFQNVFQGNGISLDSTLITFGMEVFFYGFPLGNLGTQALGIRFPLVKKATVSGWVKHKGLDKILLDGYNNLGFSGGPVVSYNTSSKKMCLVGVVSAYIPEPVSVQYKGDKLSVNENSGIIVCYGKRYIEEIFTNHTKDLR